MPLSADKLVKILHQYLSKKMTYAQLLQVGWVTFRDFDRPQTGDPLEMAIAVFDSLCIDDDGSWNENRGILDPLILFAKDYCGLIIEPVALGELKQMLAGRPLNASAAHDWFRSHCS